MSYQGSPFPVRINDGFGDPITVDAFGRQRVSNPSTIFDSKQVFSAQTLAFATSVTAGGTITYNAARASSLLATAGAGDAAIRQTRRYFNYQPGKGQLLLATFVMTAGVVADLLRRVGYFDANNGLFLELDGATLSVVRRSDVSGVIVDTPIAQANWNIDVMDGSSSLNNPSGLTLDIAQSQILFVSFEWLGVGSATFGFVIQDRFVPVHRFDNANVLSSVYMRTPNLPIRYEINSAGGVGSLESICCSVISEGGQDPVGITRAIDRNLTTKVITSPNMELVAAIRLNPTAPLNRAPVQPLGASVTVPTSANSRYCLIYYTAANYAANVGGAASWQTVPDSRVQFDVNLNTVGSRVIAMGANGQPTGGTLIYSGYFTTATSTIDARLQDILWLASDIAGAPDVLALGAVPTTGTNENYLGALRWFELS